MASYRVDESGNLIDKETGVKYVPESGRICAPRVVADVPDYISPVTGKLVSGIVQRREDLKRAGCVDGRELGPRFGKTHGVKSPALAKRLGLPLKGRDI